MVRLAPSYAIAKLEAGLVEHKLGTGGNGRMQDILANLEDFLKTRSSVTDAHKFISEMLQTAWKFKAGIYGLDLLKNEPSLSKLTQISFEKQITNSKRISDFTFKLDNIKELWVETKSFGSLVYTSEKVAEDGISIISSIKNKLEGEQFVGQFKAYLGATEDMSGFRYYFKKSDAVTEETVKKEFQMLFEKKTDEIFETIWGNQSLRESLFPETRGLNPSDLDNIKPSILLKFQNNISNTAHSFYDFIKVK